MNMIVGKKQLVLASLVVALGVAVYLNYQFAGEDLDLVTANAQQTTQELSTEEGEQENYGDAQFVDTKEFSSEETQETSLQAESGGGRGIFLTGKDDPHQDPRRSAGGAAGDALRRQPRPGTEG